MIFSLLFALLIASGVLIAIHLLIQTTTEILHHSSRISPENDYLIHTDEFMNRTIPGEPLGETYPLEYPVLSDPDSWAGGETLKLEFTQETKDAIQDNGKEISPGFMALIPASIIQTMPNWDTPQGLADISHLHPVVGHYIRYMETINDTYMFNELVISEHGFVLLMSEAPSVGMITHHYAVWITKPVQAFILAAYFNIPITCDASALAINQAAYEEFKAKNLEDTIGEFRALLEHSTAADFADDNFYD